MKFTTETVAKIEQDLSQGVLTFDEIATKYGVPVTLVYDTLESMEYSDFEDVPLDGDAASALASAGWGTDEDYGYFGGDDDF